VRTIQPMYCVRNVKVMETAFDTTEKYVAHSNINIHNFGSIVQGLHVLELSQILSAINLSRAATASFVTSRAS
jgi:hypothetical protein